MSTNTDPQIQTYQLPDGRVIQGTPEQIQVQINEALAQKRQAETQQAQNSGIDMQEYERRFLRDPIEAQDWAYQQKYGFQPTQAIVGMYQELQQLKRQFTEQRFQAFSDVDEDTKKLARQIYSEGRVSNIEDAITIAKSSRSASPQTNPLEIWQKSQINPQTQVPAGAAPPILSSQGAPAGAQLTLQDIEQQTAGWSLEDLRRTIEQAHQQR